MAVATYQVTVGTTPVQFRPDPARLVPPSASLLVYNRGSVAVFIGSSSVTAATGFQVDAGETLSVPVGAVGDKVYGVTASGSTTCHVIQTDSYA